MAIGHRVGMVGQFTNILQNASASAERILEITHEPQVIKSGKLDLPGFALPANLPTPDPSQEGSRRSSASSEFPSWEGLGVGSESQCERKSGSELSTEPPLTHPTEGLAAGPPQRFGRVQFDHVSFNYSDGKASLADVSFEAAPGQTIAVVGPTGSGKTTLVNLIPRFYDTSGGRVFVDGVDVRELKLGQLRRSVSVIFQETFLFSATVAENIAYGRPDAGRREIEESARAAQSHEFIMELEAGYNTVVRERGGQKQRIAIARAFLMNPRILNLDDATASVDSGTERLIRAAMSGLRQKIRRAPATDRGPSV